MGIVVEDTLTDRQRYWLEQIQACKASGKTIAEYAKAQGLDAKAMYAGKKALVRKGVLPRTRAVRFQRARVFSEHPGGEWRIQLPNGVSVVFAGPVDASALSLVLNTAACVE
jgi:predicted transcriptional regulator